MEESNQERERPKRDWAGIVEAQSNSGQTAGKWCRGNGIRYKLFLYHRRKFLQSGKVLRAKRRRRGISSAFVPVQLSSTVHTVVRMPSGVILECDRLPEVKWLIELAKRFSDKVKASC